MRTSLKLKAIHRFTSTAAAVEEITALREYKITKTLKKFLSEEVAGKGKSKHTLAVFEAGLGTHYVIQLHSVCPFRCETGKAIKEKLDMNVVSPKMTELFHGIRSQLTALLDGLDQKDLATMSLGLSHSLSRYVHYQFRCERNEWS